MEARLVMKRQGLTHVDICGRLLDVIATIHERRRACLAARHHRRSHVRPSPALQALCANAISVDEYLMLKLEAAIAPLQPLLRPEHLTAVRAAMRERLRTEPAWVKVVDEMREMMLREGAVPQRGELRSPAR